MHATDERTLMKQARLALRAAKKLGMNQLQFHDAPVKAKGERNTAQPRPGRVAPAACAASPRSRSAFGRSP
jgi:hypothetical protein